MAYTKPFHSFNFDFRYAILAVDTQADDDGKRNISWIIPRVYDVGIKEGIQMTDSLCNLKIVEVQQICSAPIHILMPFQNASFGFSVVFSGPSITFCRFLPSVLDNGLVQSISFRTFCFLCKIPLKANLRMSQTAIFLYFL